MHFPVQSDEFLGLFQKLAFLLAFYRIFGEFYIFWIQGAILWTLQTFLITSEYVITIWDSHLHVLISALTQNKSVLNQRWKRYVSELRKSALNSADSLRNRLNFSDLNSGEFFSSEQRWFRKNQSWSALMLFMFSDSALKNVKSLK